MHFTPNDSYYSLDSERLIYRKLSLTDVPLWMTFFENNPSLPYLGMTSAAFKDLSNEEKAQKWIERQIERADSKLYGQLAVIEKSSGNFIGIGGLIERADFDPIEYEITYSLIPKYHGKGYGTELAKRFKSYAESQKIDHIMSIIHVDNAASINVARKNGLIPGKVSEYMEMPVKIFRPA